MFGGSPKSACRSSKSLPAIPGQPQTPGPANGKPTGVSIGPSELGDRKAEDEAIVDLIRAQMWQWWPDLPERQLLVDLYRRAAQRIWPDAVPPTAGAGPPTPRASGLPRRFWLECRAGADWTPIASPWRLRRL